MAEAIEDDIKLPQDRACLLHIKQILSQGSLIFLRITEHAWLCKMSRGGEGLRVCVVCARERVCVCVSSDWHMRFIQPHS
jgi:hypothetical protein